MIHAITKFHRSTAMSVGAFWGILFWVWMASELTLQLATRTGRNGGNLRDRGSLGILLSTIVVSIVLGTKFGDPPPHTIANGAHWVRSAAVLILITGLALRWTAILTLGKAFSVNVAIRANQTVQKTGLYRFMRHPSYTGLTIIFFAIGLSTRSWLGLAIVVLPSLAALLYRIHVEEAALSDAFGPEYQDYKAATKRLIPGVY